MIHGTIKLVFPTVSLSVGRSIKVRPPILVLSHKAPQEKLATSYLSFQDWDYLVIFEVWYIWYKDVEFTAIRCQEIRRWPGELLAQETV